MTDCDDLVRAIVYRFHYLDSAGRQRTKEAEGEMERISVESELRGLRVLRVVRMETDY